MSKRTRRKKAQQASLQTATAKQKRSGKSTWKMMDRASTIGAALVARKLTATSWKVATGKQPPSNSKHPDVSNAEAVTWAIVAGATIELTKVLIRRGTANYWIKSTGSLPPGVKPLKTPAGEAAEAARLAASGNEKPAAPHSEVSAGKTSRRRR